MRHVEGGEVELPTFTCVRREDPPTERAVEQIAVGVSTRKYARSLDPPPADAEERGTSRSAVSRRFVVHMPLPVSDEARRWLGRFDLPDACPDKVLPLAEAVRGAVRPGMALHFAFTHNRPSAAIREVLRQFRGRDPGFTIVMLFTAGPATALVSEGLARRLVTTLCTEPYPAAAPSRPVQRAVARGLVAIEHWSVLSLIARLQAAALGMPGMPVRSLAGSTLFEENRDALAEFPGGGALLARALRPDLSFVHAAAADRAGNVLCAAPHGEGPWGAMAAREGVVVTCERLVDTDTVRRFSHLCAIPASHVRSVSVVPMGAHPAGLAAAEIPGVEPYADDVAFYAAGREAGRDDESWRRFVDEWLAGPADHDAYLARLGAERLHCLKGRARPDSWRAELLPALHRVPRGPATRTEAMIATAARFIGARLREREYRAILSGFGAANLAAWLARDMLDGEPVEIVAEIGLYGYRPRPCDPHLFSQRNLATCTRTGGAWDTLGLLVGGAGARAIGSLSAAQVDARGRINSTRLADGTLITGSGGANDVASIADEVVLAVPADPRRLCEEVPYVTGPGTRVTALVTDFGVFEKPPGDARLRLTRLVPPLHGGGAEAHVRDLRARVGFAFEAAADLAVEPEPDAEQVTLLRLYDPERAFLGPLP